MHTICLTPHDANTPEKALKRPIMDFISKILLPLLNDWSHGLFCLPPDPLWPGLLGPVSPYTVKAVGTRSLIGHSFALKALCLVINIPYILLYRELARRRLNG